MIKLTEKGILIESRTTRAEFSGIRLVSLQDALSGEEFLDRAAGEKVPGFQLLHQNGGIDRLGEHAQASKVYFKLLTETIAEIVLEDWECDLSVRVSIDEASGDILLEPSAWTMAGGIAGLEFAVAGVRADLDLIAPFQQGFRGSLSSPQVQGKHSTWPNMWEAGVVSFAGPASGFSVQAWDSLALFKGVNIGHAGCPQTASFVTYANGPLEMNRCAGNLCWRISAYQGEWQKPFLRYADWYWKTYRLDEKASLRPDWLNDLALGVSWCPTQPALLDALARKIDPNKVFLHLPNWRTGEYDQEYPSYKPSPEGRAFILKARAMGFHVAPHTNYCMMSPDHPLFFSARDFCTRSPNDLRWGGWSWMPVKGWASFGPPQSYSNMPTHKAWNVLVEIHLAWSPWRRHITREVAEMIQDTGIDSVFVDVSHYIHNSDNATLENLSYAEGSLKLAQELVELQKGLCVTGEGRNEITNQYQSVAQFHLYNYAHTLDYDGKDVSWVESCTLPVSALIFKGLSRGMGYHYGTGPNRQLFIDTTIKQGAMPTLIFKTPDPVSELENEESRYILERAVG